MPNTYIPQTYPLYVITAELDRQDASVGWYVREPALVVAWVDCDTPGALVPVVAALPCTERAMTYSDADGDGCEYHLFHTLPDAVAAEEGLLRQYDRTNAERAARAAGQ